MESWEWTDTLRPWHGRVSKEGKIGTQKSGKAGKDGQRWRHGKHVGVPGWPQYDRGEGELYDLARPKTMPYYNTTIRLCEGKKAINLLE